jgi:hypothetical protein
MNRLVSRTALPVLGLVGALSLTACSNAEPGRGTNEDHTRAVRISVSANSPEQQVLGELYSQVLQDTPREGNRLELLYAAETDLIISCTGLMLHQLDPERAEELSGTIDPHETHREFMGALPAHLTAPDPSPAQGCSLDVLEQQVPDLPQSIIPVYRRDLFDRAELKAISSVTYTVTDEELEGLIETAGDKSSVSAAVEEWLGY